MKTVSIESKEKPSSKLINIQPTDSDDKYSVRVREGEELIIKLIDGELKICKENSYQVFYIKGYGNKDGEIEKLV